MSASMDSLLKPIVIGRATLKNRAIMAPLTRVRADDNHIPTPMMVKHYADRASAGLIIAEATMVKPGYSTFGHEPGIYSEEQIEAWKQVTEEVHNKGGVIFLQLHHGGRATVQANLAEGLQVEAPSAIAIEGHQMLAEYNLTGERQPYPVPTELTEDGIQEIIELFAQGAKNAIAAGFDGVEVHGANGYVIDEFFRSSSNKRSAPYGGSMENRCNFTIEVTEAVCKAIGSHRVGLRISPLNQYNGQSDENPEALTKHICERLNELNLAFLHVMRGDFFSPATGATAWAREVYKGTLITNMGYTPAEADETIASGKADAVAFGSAFIANADLVERITAGAELNVPRPELFYDHSAGETGYNDYPLMGSKRIVGTISASTMTKITERRKSQVL